MFNIFVVKYFVLGISPKDIINMARDKISVTGSNILRIFKGLNPKLVITINSYSPDNLDKDNTSDKKNDMGKV